MSALTFVEYIERVLKKRDKKYYTAKQVAEFVSKDNPAYFKERFAISIICEQVWKFDSEINCSTLCPRPCWFRAFIQDRISINSLLLYFVNETVMSGYFGMLGPFFSLCNECLQGRLSQAKEYDFNQLI